MYNFRMVRNYGNLAIVPLTVEIRDRQGYIVKRYGGFSHNRLLRKAHRWADRHGG